MSKFLTPLRAEEVKEATLLGNAWWKLLSPLIYNSSTVGLIIAETNMLTDFESLGRLPFFYVIFGNRGNGICVIHDKLYSPPHTTGLVDALGNMIVVTRAVADKILRGAIYDGLRLELQDYEGTTLKDKARYVGHALKVSGNNVAAFGIAWGMWVGLRVGGASHWK